MYLLPVSKYLSNITNFDFTQDGGYFKVTNENECHHNFQYQDGLNVDTKPFNKYGSCCEGGLYFSDKANIHKFYHFGVWIRKVTFPVNDTYIVKDDSKWRANKLIMGPRFSMFEESTYSKFGIKKPCMDLASQMGYIQVLNWWKYSGLELKYTSDALDSACRLGHVAVLEWWKCSGLELYYTSNAVDLASHEGHVDVLEWWKCSGLKLRYTGNALNWANQQGHLNVLEWWNDSNFELKYT